MVEDRIAALEARVGTLEERVREPWRPRRRAAGRIGAPSRRPRSPAHARADRARAPTRPAVPPRPPSRRPPARARPRGLPRRQRARLARRHRRARRARVPAHDRDLARLARRGRAHRARRRALARAARPRACGCASAAAAPRPRWPRPRSGIAGAVRHARRRRPGLRPRPAAARAARRVRHRRRRDGARHPLARAGDGLARPARRAAARPPRSAPSTAAAWPSSAIAYAATSPCSSGSAGPRSASPPSSSTTLQWVMWVLLDGTAAAALDVFGAADRRLALGLELNRRGLTPVEIGPRGARRTSARPPSACSSSTRSCWPRPAGTSLDGEPWLVALAAAHLAVGLAATRVPRDLPRARADRARRSASCSPTSRSPRSPAASRSCSAGPSPRSPFAALLGARSDKPNGMTKLVDAVIGRPDDAAARRADRILATAGLLGQIALAGFHGLAVRRAARASSPAARRRHGAGRRRRASRSSPGPAARLADRACAPWLDALALALPSRTSPGLALEGAALAARSPPRRSRWPALARRSATASPRGRRSASPPSALAPRARHARTAGRAHRRPRRSRSPPPARSPRRAARFALAARRSAHPARAPPAAPRPRSPCCTWPASRSSRSPARSTPGQTLLSVLWARRGRRRADPRPADRRPRRCAGPRSSCSALTAGKVFLYDLASLDSLYRVGSLIGLRPAAAVRRASPGSGCGRGASRR